jgi:hypothetical protein
VTPHFSNRHLRSAVEHEANVPPACIHHCAFSFRIARAFGGTMAGLFEDIGP